MNRQFGVNQGLVEEYLLRYRENPASVSKAWQDFFRKNAAEMRESTPPGSNNGYKQKALDGSISASFMLPLTAEHVPTHSTFPPSEDHAAATHLQGKVSALINAHRVRGHLYADLDPLGLLKPPTDNELTLKAYNLAHVDPDTPFFAGTISNHTNIPLKEIDRRLKETYCRTIGVEFTHVEKSAARTWLQERMESTCNRLRLTRDEQILILTKLIDAEMFEQFLHTNYVGAKRFSLEGAESVIPLLELVVQSAGQHRIEEIVIGMAHRGRLNVLANVMEKNLKAIFAAFEDEHPELHLGRGDVKYHMGYSSDREMPDGHRIHLSLAFNPSHLEWVNPVVEGRVRAKQERRGDTEGARVLPLVIHGDAAFAGQGVVAETLNLSELEGYKTGGTIHVVINNQIGFTTLPKDGRSCRYATDITRMLRCPIFHVNGEDPEAAAQVVRLAMDFRQKFKQDVVIDVYCYRRHGHNEGDEPRFTQPVMYAAIDEHHSVRQVYVEKLLETKLITEQESEEIAQKRRVALEAALKETRDAGFVPTIDSGDGVWKGYSGGSDYSVADVDEKIGIERLQQLLQKCTETPKTFSVNRKIERLLKQRRDQATGKRPLDWGAAETLAYATLVDAGFPIRLSGQDSKRGTFSHRHAVLFDANNGNAHVPLRHIRKGQGYFEVLDSPLSESGVLGFEYGYSLDYPDALVIWEAQFGDFANSAQVIIDQFISSSEDKWKRLSGLTLLLPHGFEGQGPEHSSARLERFLVMCAEHNMQVCNLTSPAQIYHCLRRQVLRPYRKPLVIMSPKSLLRHPQATSTLQECAEGSFQRIIKDTIDPKKVTRILLCSGKIFYDLAAEREKLQAEHVAIIRLEQLYPIRSQELKDALAPYKKGTDMVWVQEEPRNMGGWYFMNAHLPHLTGNRFPLRCISRPQSASPATGSMASHKLEHQWLLDGCFADSGAEAPSGFADFAAE